MNVISVWPKRAGAHSLAFHRHAFENARDLKFQITLISAVIAVSQVGDQRRRNNHVDVSGRTAIATHPDGSIICEWNGEHAV